MVSCNRCRPLSMERVIGEWWWWTEWSKLVRGSGEELPSFYLLTATPTCLTTLPLVSDGGCLRFQHDPLLQSAIRVHRSRPGFRTESNISRQDLKVQTLRLFKASE